MSLSRFSPHGLQKGATTHATNRTTVAPSVPAIACRGKWSVGTVLDYCWHFLQTEYQHSGRVLTGLHPTSSNFDCIPLHFELENPMSNPSVERAMKIICGDFLHEHPDFTRILHCCLASIVHHKNALIDRMLRVPEHNFNSIAVLHEPALLE